VILHGPPGARPLVLANALGTTSELWEPQIPSLAGRFRVVRYEYLPRDSVRALGRDVLDLADERGLERFSFCGLSLGGMVGMWLAVNAPERIERLVLACTTARFGAPEEWRRRAALARADGLNELAEAAADRWFTRGFVDRARYVEMNLATSPAAYAAGCAAIGGFDFRASLGQIAAPTLVIAGAEDTATTPADATFIAQRVPNGRLVIIEGAAHLANVERPDAFTAAVVDHLEKGDGT
jgi:3-oxoadipate enol-lactonase